MLNTNIQYFKTQAKKFFKDYQTQFINDEQPDYEIYDYKAKYFDVDRIILDYNFQEPDKTDFTLMNAQHIIAIMTGFKSWGDLLKASNAKLEIEKLFFDNQNNINKEEFYMLYGEYNFDIEVEIEILKDMISKNIKYTNILGYKIDNLEEKNEFVMMSKNL